MSFYNMLFGSNPNKEVILSLIGLKECDIERFRDCIILNDHIEIYTRTGGGNRSEYPNELLINNQWYKYDEDDFFDRTYATYYFNVPEEIKKDVDGLFNPQEVGLSGNLITWIMKTLDRPETENDKYNNAYKKQMELVKELQRTMDVSKAFNGHTVIPLSDHGMNRMLSEIEKFDGKFVAYWYFLPYKFKMLQNEPKWNSERNKSSIEQDQVRVGIDIQWEIDNVAWERYKAKFAEKYPKSIMKMKQIIDSK